MTRVGEESRAYSRPSWRKLLAPGLATLVAFAILIALGIWQLERKVWKEGLLAQIGARAYGSPVPIQPEAEWSLWRPDSGEFTRVRVTGTFQSGVEIPIHGLAKPGQQALQGFYLFAPLLQKDGSTVFINRGFVPTEIYDRNARPKLPTGLVSVVGLERAPETRGNFVPANDPVKHDWFVRDLDDMSRASSISRAAPFYVDADSTPNPGGWPRGGQTQLVLPNDHLQYALTWFGLAATLLGVVGTVAWRNIGSRVTDNNRPPPTLRSTGLGAARRSHTSFRP